MSENKKMTIYELNKNYVSTLPLLELDEIKNKLATYQEWSKDMDNDHFMLLCNDFNYFTVFEKKDGIKEKFDEALFDIISNLGEIVSIDLKDETKSAEIWIKDDKKDIYLFFLFPYSKGVVYYE